MDLPMFYSLLFIVFFVFVHPLRSSGISKQAYYKRLETYKTKELNEETLKKMVKEMRQTIGQQTGGIKLHSELKQQMKT
ncbi:MAG: hypothetical protein L3J09_07835, partial [Flavobacteriaceae bacterium]|nr:hypothetical protein [Flavobacteriaceae bacterium]